uniref:Oligodendrocyte myelin glycoprotein n=1 Tax=Salvator merianae TaxID=96440 RepID=A0A8D0DQV7_SALMN
MENRAAKTAPFVLALLVFVRAAQGRCPAVCSCSGNDRNADCSGRNLSTLPDGLQDNVTYLNLSYNHLGDLNHQLTRFANLRSLDVSHNVLQNLPAYLPRSLWEIYAAHNHIRVLQKLDTAYQWNLKVLDVSSNMVERAVLINNTMTSLRFLNLSSNRLWTVPTNIPSNTETVDLSNNSLTQILPGTLVRLTRLSKLHLHDNKFTYIPDAAFDQLAQLQLITLYNNPWSCDDGTAALSYIKKWAGETRATVVGPPCPEEAAMPSTAAPRSSAAPTAAENHFLVKAMKAKDPAGFPATTEQTQFVPPRFRMKEASLSATPGQTTAFTSTGRPLSLSPEDLSTEKFSSYEAEAATRTIYIQKAASINSSTTGLAGHPTTPMTLSITSGAPTNYSKRPHNTTVTVKREETSTKMNRQVPSEANICKGNLSFMLTAAALVTVYGFVLK